MKNSHINRPNQDSTGDFEERQKAFQKAEDQFQKTRTPFYIIVVVAFLIGIINSIYIGSAAIFVMCLIFGGGTFIYLYRTRYNGPDLPKTSDRLYDPARKGDD